MFGDTKMKYVRTGAYDNILIFDVTLEHSTFKFLNPISAGFCYVSNEKVECFGESISLDLKSNTEDSILATKQLWGEEAAIKLQNET